MPGAGIYWTVYYLVTEQLGLAVYTGYEAVKAAVAIVLGIVFVFELPQGVFRCMAKAFVKIPSCRPFGEKVVDVAGTLPYYDGIALCVAADDETDAVNREDPTV